MKNEVQPKLRLGRRHRRELLLQFLLLLLLLMVTADSNCGGKREIDQEKNGEDLGFLFGLTGVDVLPDPKEKGKKNQIPLNVGRR